MLGIYRQSVSRIDKNKKSKEKKYTEHDKYAIARSGCQKKKKKNGFRSSKSAVEIYNETFEETSFRSASFQDLRKFSQSCKSEISHPKMSKIDSLAKLFSCVGVADEKVEASTSRHNEGSYAYTALDPGATIQERLEMETKACERAQGVCSHYLESNLRYTLVDQLDGIGSRFEKHWFVVRDSSVKTERLLTLVARGTKCPIRCDPETRSVVLDLFLALQHPYIYPILDVNFREIGGSTYIFTTLPLNEKGSLKDFIYKSKWRENWRQKYFHKAKGLPISQVQRLARQILEALVFLRERGFPACGHFHSGNIILQNGVARITGLENALLGLNSRIRPLLLPRANSDPEALDSLCFGHVLFEMCAGYELDSAHPSPASYLDVHEYPQVVEVLEFIFDPPELRVPAVEDLLLCDLFRNIDLREIRNQAQSTVSQLGVQKNYVFFSRMVPVNCGAPYKYPRQRPQVFKTNLTEKAIELLEEVKRSQNTGRSLRGEHENALRDKSTSSGGSDNEVEDDDYDADTNSESENPKKKEHKSLSLHANSSNRVYISIRRTCDESM